MAKRKGATVETKTEPAKPAKEKKTKIPKPRKPPAMPFGDALPSYDQGSPADGNWKPKGDPIADISALEQQERKLYWFMMMAKDDRDLAKIEARTALHKAEQMSITDGFDVGDKTKLHRQADSAERRAAKSDKEYKRAREGWNSVKLMIHRYLTDPEQPLFEQGKKKADKAA